MKKMTNTSTKQARDINNTGKVDGLKEIKQNQETNVCMQNQEADVHKGNTHQQLRSAGPKGGTEDFVMTARDQSLFTRKYQAKIIKNGAHQKSRFCKKFEETVDHLGSGCRIMTPDKYLQRHDIVGQYIHWKIHQHYNAPYAKNR